MIVFVSGTHGSGKTTLIKDLNQYRGFKELDFDINFLKTYPSMGVMNAYEKCLLRLYHRFYTAEYARDKDKEAKEVLMVSRSIYDSLVYSYTEFMLGEMTADEYKLLKEIGENCLKFVDAPTIILNPDIEVIMSRLEKRRDEGSRIERNVLCAREDTYTYVKLVHDKFEEYRDNPNILYITDNGEAEKKKILEWVSLQ